MRYTDATFNYPEVLQYRLLQIHGLEAPKSILSTDKNAD